MRTDISPAEKATALITHSGAFGHALGYKDFTDLHEGWINRMVCGKEDMTLQAHRGSYKTTCLCVAIALLMIKERDKNVIFLRKTDADVAEVINSVARILQHPVFVQLYRALTNSDLLITKNTSAEIITSAYQAPRGAPQLQGIGIGGSLTGKHADIIITDDIVNLRDRVSRAERDRTKAIYQELQNIRNRGGRIINTGTPWHQEDAFTLMPEPERWDCYSTGLLSEAKIEALRRSMSPSLFAANYELRHIAAENALFTEPPEFYSGEGNPLMDGFAHIDAAYGGEDWTALTCGKRVGDKIYMFGQMWHTHVDTVLGRILDLIEQYGCAPVYCEDNADKGFLMKEIRRLSPTLPVRSYHEKENKYQKISEYLRKWWPNIIWMQDTGRDYLAQIMDFTEDAEHDDAPDSAACICRIFDRRGLLEYNSIYGGVVR